MAAKTSALAVGALMLGFLLGLDSLLVADTVHLTNGRIVTGTVIEDTPEQISIEIEEGKIRAVLKFKRSDVKAVFINSLSSGSSSTTSICLGAI